MNVIHISLSRLQTFHTQPQVDISPDDKMPVYDTVATGMHAGESVPQMKRKKGFTALFKALWSSGKWRKNRKRDGLTPPQVCAKHSSSTTTSLLAHPTSLLAKPTSLLALQTTDETTEQCCCTLLWVRILPHYDGLTVIWSDGLTFQPRPFIGFI